MSRIRFQIWQYEFSRTSPRQNVERSSGRAFSIISTLTWCVSALVAKPLIAEQKSSLLPFSVPDNLRTIFLGARHLGEDQWNQADWTNAAMRGLEALVSRFEVEVSPGHRRTLAKTIFSIAATFGIEDPRLVFVAQSLTEISGWTTDWKVDVLPVDDVSDSWMNTLACGIGVVMMRQNRPRDQVATDLERLILRHSSSIELDVLRYFAAEALRDCGNLERSRFWLDQLVTRNSAYAQRAVHADIHLLRRESKFRAAEGLLLKNRDLLTFNARLSGDLKWPQARFEDSAADYRRGADESLARGDAGEEGSCLAGAAFAIAFIDPGRALGWAADASALLAANHVSFASLQSRLATAVAIAKLGNTDAESEILEVRAHAVRLKHSSIVAYSSFALCLVASSREGHSVALRLSELTELTQSGQFLYLQEVAETFMLLSSPPRPRSRSAEWGDEGVLGRWARVATDWRIGG